MQHTGIKASFEKNIHFVGHSNNVTLYKRLHEFVSRYALNHIEDELDRVKFVGVDNDSCRCIIRYTYSLPYACELARYIIGNIPLVAINIFWTRLSFADMGSNESYADMSVRQEFDVILKHFASIGIAGKVTKKISFMK